MERLDFFFLASYENRHMDPDPGIEPPPPAQRSGDDRGDGNVRPLREPSPAREAEGAAREGASEATPPPRRLLHLRACEEEQQRQETTCSKSSCI